MGYMGFGMRKEVYTRKPKTSFSKIKEVYGNNLERVNRTKHSDAEWSLKEKEDFKDYVRAKIRKNRISGHFSNAVVFIIIFVVLVYSFYVVFSNL